MFNTTSVNKAVIFKIANAMREAQKDGGGVCYNRKGRSMLTVVRAPNADNDVRFKIMRFGVDITNIVMQRVISLSDKDQVPESVAYLFIERLAA